MARAAAVLGAWLLMADAKFQSAQVTLGGASVSWQYLDKFGFETGSSELSIRARLAKPSNATAGSMKFLGYLDERWPEADATSDLCERENIARFDRQVQLPTDGQWGEWTTLPVRQTIRPHIWYFAFSRACERDQSVEHSLEYELKILQPTKSHFSVEMRYMLPLNSIALLAFSCFLAFFGCRCQRTLKQVGSIHSVVWVLAAAMLLHFVGLALHTLHLTVYAGNGVGLRSFDLLHEVLFMASQVVESSLLLMIALGYTLFHSTMEELASVRPIIGAIASVHALLVGCSKLNDGASNKYHENEGVIGWLLLTIRVALYLWFLVALRGSERRGGMRLQSFLSEFRVAGSLYFLAFPTIFVFVQLWAPYLQHPIMQTGLLAMQAASHAWLSSLFLTRGNYFKVSALSSSLLPGFGACSGNKLF